MPRMTKQDAQSLATEFKIPLDVAFHSLPSDTVNRVLDAANRVRYRHPPGANGSRARYFHQHLARLARRED